MVDINLNNENIRQVINNADFAQFLSENLSENGVSQEEIAHLINIFANQPENNINRQSIAASLNSSISIRDSAISNQSILHNNNSSPKVDNQYDINIARLRISDFSDAPAINNRNSNIRNTLKNANNAAPNLSLDLSNLPTKEYENGIYQGQLVDNKREGKGIMYYEDGNYQGEFKNDKKDGKGLYYYKNGDREMGDYSNGKKIGKHILLKNNGKIEIKEYNHV